MGLLLSSFEINTKIDPFLKSIFTTLQMCNFDVTLSKEIKIESWFDKHKNAMLLIKRHYRINLKYWIDKQNKNLLVIVTFGHFFAMSSMTQSQVHSESLLPNEDMEMRKV